MNHFKFRIPLLSTFCFLLSVLALRAELIPAARVIDWQPGVNVGVPGGIAQFRPGGASERTHTGTHDRDGVAGTNSGDHIDVTQAPYSADNTGATDVRAILQSAINHCGTGQVVYLPAGTYRIDGQLNLGTGFAGKTLRGAGMDVTIIDARTNIGISIGSGGGFWHPVTPYGAAITAGLTGGSTTITVPDSYPWVAGNVLKIGLENDPTIPVVSVYNYDIWTNQTPQHQLVRVVSKSGDDTTFYPPLHTTHTGLAARVSLMSFTSSGIGLEDMTVDGLNFGDALTGSYAGVTMGECYGSWIYNVKSIKSQHYGFTFGDVLQCEVRHCYGGERKGGGSSGAGLLLLAHSCLIEDNIFVDSFPALMDNGGSSGNAFLYNFSNGMTNTNHAPHNRFNLHEGNAWHYLISDGYFGGESDLTVFRNYLWGPTVGTVHMRRWSRNFSIVGNLHAASGLGDHGYPNMGNIGFSGTAQPSLGDYWRDYALTGTLTTRTSDTVGIITLTEGTDYLGYDPLQAHVIRLTWGTPPENQRFAYTSSSGNVVGIINHSGGTVLPAQGTLINIGPGAYFDGNYADRGSYQERDLDVAATTIDKGNYYIGSNTLTSLGGDSLPPGLAYTSTPPGWPSSLAWPPFNPADPTTADVKRIPAGYRYAHSGEDPAGIPGDRTAPTKPESVVATAVSAANQIDVIWNASSDNVGVTGYRIERSSGLASSGFVPVGTTTTTSFSNSGLSAGTVFNYRVCAIDAAGNISIPSSVASASTAPGTADATAPTVPRNLVAVASGATQINLSWSASTDNVGVVGYRMERSQGAGSSAFTEVAPPVVPGAGDSGLLPGTIYNYRVRALDAAGNLSGYSNVGTATTANPTDTLSPSVPASVVAIAADASQINLTWTASTDNVGVAGYQVERSQGPGSTAYIAIGAPATAGFGDSGLVASTVYNYRVRAADANGNVSGFSSVATVTTGVAMPSGLVAFFAFEEGSGAAVTDGSGNGNTGMINGATRTALGRFGRALSFNGVDNLVLVNASPSLNFTSQTTLSAWIFPTASQSGWRTILHKETDAWYLHACNPMGAMQPAGGAIFNGGEQYVGDPTALPLNEWTHLATTYDGTTLRLYVNGAEVANRPQVGSIEANSMPLRIGGNTYADQFFSGKIDEVRIYNRALSRAEIQSIMSTPVAAPKAPSGLRIVGQ